MRQLVESLNPSQWLFVLIGGIVLAIVGVIVWMIVGTGPRRRRKVRAVQRLLAKSQWQDALKAVEELRVFGRPSEAAMKSFNHLEGEALQLGSAERLANKDYDGALAYALQSARLRDDNPLEPRARIQNALLDEARRQFARTTGDDIAGVLDLLHRAIRVQSPCREASFWQALCLLRVGDVEQAIEHLHVARTGMERSFRPQDDASDGSPASPILEPPLYLGALLLQQGHAKDALRYIAEANRLDATCPIVPLLTGCGMIASGGDATLAVRTLQKSLIRLSTWTSKPETFWAEVYPETRSYVRKLAISDRFQCPLWGEGPAGLMRQGQLALAQGLQRLGQNEESVALFDQTMKTGAPTPAALRGQGLGLARLGRFDEAFKPLRHAYDLDPEPKDRLTSGYLALCSVKATPASPGDVPKNAAWAVKAVTPFSAPGDAEWVGLISQIFAAARTAGVPLDADEQVYLCEHLVSVKATDELAAAAFTQIFAEHPHLLLPEYAWLYAQAVTERGLLEAASLPLLEQAFQDQPAALAFFDSRGWSLERVLKTYLVIAARARPGQLPTVLGEDPKARAEALLLGGSRLAEESGDLDEARALVEAFSRLVPHHPGALDRLAALHHRAGRTAQAIAALLHWQQRYPRDPLPLVRLALLRAGSEELRESLDLLTMAHDLAEGSARAQIALAAARLALREGCKDGVSSADADAAILPPASAPSRLLTKEEAWARADAELQRAAADDPACDEAVALLAALRWLRGDTAGLSALAERCRSMRSSDPRHQYFAALSLASANDWEGVVAACRSVSRLVGDRNGELGALAVEAAYLEGVAHAERGDADAAVESLTKPASADSSPSAPFAQGLLGAMLFHQGKFDAASVWWQKLPTATRSAWKIGEVLGGTHLLAALEAFQNGQFETAADRFRQAGKLGCRDRRLGPLMLAALVKAGKQAIYGG